MLKHVRKYLKLRRLIRFYHLTERKIEEDIRINIMFIHDIDFRRNYAHRRICELRCCKRLKLLEINSVDYPAIVRHCIIVSVLISLAIPLLPLWFAGLSLFCIHPILWIIVGLCWTRMSVISKLVI